MAFERKQRKIYRYSDGSRMLGIDPLEADVAIQAIDLDWEAKFTLMRVGDLGAAMEVVAAARRVFRLPEFIIAADGTESGVSSAEVLDLLLDFLTWKTSLADFTVPPQTSPQSTAANPEATASGTAGT